MNQDAYLLEVAEALWPGDPSPSVHRGRPDDRREDLVAVPSARAPRLLLPSDRAAAAAGVRAYGNRGSVAGRLRTRAAGGLFSSGLGHVFFPDRVRVGGLDPGILDELATILGEPVRIALRAGPPRANRKPVLAVLGARGELLAFAKLAVNPLTETLLATEAAALSRLAGVRLDGVQVPRLLHHGRWQGRTLLVQEALPVCRAGAVGDPQLVRGVAAVAGATGTSTGSWGSSPHAVRVRERMQRVPRTPEAGLLAEAVDRLAADGEVLPLGTWHGDWTPWNSANRKGSLLLWDWERFDTGAPVGFDLLHHDLQAALAVRCDQRRPEALLAGAERRLAPLGLAPAQSRRTALAYLVELASRYLVDDQTGAGARVGDVGGWLLPVLVPAARDLPDHRGEKNP